MTLPACDRIIELSENATPGPWLRDPHNDARMQVIAHGNEVIVYHHQHNRQIDKRVVPNMQFIAEACTLAKPLALALNEAVRAIEEAQARFERLGRMPKIDQDDEYRLRGGCRDGGRQTGSALARINELLK